MGCVMSNKGTTGGWRGMAVALLLAGLAWTGLAQAASVQAQEMEVVEAINRIRAEHGLQPVTLDPRLQDAARRHSTDMAVSQCFQHDDCDGAGNWSDRIYSFYPRPERIAENIAAGRAGATATVEAWMRSPVHRANILRPEWRGTGVSLVSLPGSPYEHYWTQTFGSVPVSIVPVQMAISSPR